MGQNFNDRGVPQLNGLVLCGGKSTRMGQGKEGLCYHGKSQREHLTELLAEQCNEVYVSCSAKPEVLNPGCPVIEDAFSGLGPMGGVLSAFQKHPRKAWLVIACDYPLISNQTISQLVSSRNPSKTATAFYDVQGKLPEPLITIWEPRSYSYLLRLLSNGHSSLRKALIGTDTELITIHNTAELFNSNTPNDYESALAFIKGQREAIYSYNSRI